MSETSKLNKATIAAGVGLLPQTSDAYFSYLPIVGFSILIVILVFMLYNKLIRKWYGVK